MRRRGIDCPAASVGQARVTPVVCPPDNHARTPSPASSPLHYPILPNLHLALCPSPVAWSSAALLRYVAELHQALWPSSMTGSSAAASTSPPQPTLRLEPFFSDMVQCCFSSLCFLIYTRPCQSPQWDGLMYVPHALLLFWLLFQLYLFLHLAAVYCYCYPKSYTISWKNRFYLIFINNHYFDICYMDLIWLSYFSFSSSVLF